MRDLSSIKEQNERAAQEMLRTGRRAYRNHPYSEHPLDNARERMAEQFASEVMESVRRDNERRQAIKRGDRRVLKAIHNTLLGAN